MDIAVGATRSQIGLVLLNLPTKQGAERISRWLTPDSNYGGRSFLNKNGYRGLWPSPRFCVGRIPFHEIHCWRHLVLRKMLMFSVTVTIRLTSQVFVISQGKLTGHKIHGPTLPYLFQK